MSTAASLQVRGFRLTPWVHDSALTCFKFETTDGLLDLSDAIRLIAVFNDKSGNRAFVRLVEALEGAARENHAPVQIVQLWNERLAAWFKRRGYSVREESEFGKYAEMKPAEIA